MPRPRRSYRRWVTLALASRQVAWSCPGLVDHLVVRPAEPRARRGRTISDLQEPVHLRTEDRLARPGGRLLPVDRRVRILVTEDRRARRRTWVGLQECTDRPARRRTWVDRPALAHTWARTDRRRRTGSACIRHRRDRTGHTVGTCIRPQVVRSASATRVPWAWGRAVLARVVGRTIVGEGAARIRGSDFRQVLRGGRRQALTHLVRVRRVARRTSGRTAVFRPVLVRPVVRRTWEAVHPERPVVLGARRRIRRDGRVRVHLVIRVRHLAFRQVPTCCRRGVTTSGHPVVQVPLRRQVRPTRNRKSIR